MFKIYSLTKIHLHRLLLLIVGCIGFSATAQNAKLYVGTYTENISKGIYTYNFNENTGELSNKILVAKAVNPSFITFSSDKKYLYAVGEVAHYNNTSSGFVSAYKVLNNGSLEFLNMVSSEGADPCHIALNSKNTKVVVSNYTGGNFALFDILKDGSISKAFQIVSHTTKTAQAHVHFGEFLNNHLYISDLGLNTVYDYMLTDKNYELNRTYFIEKYAGPRHFVFTENAGFMYVINELNSTITVLKKEANFYKIIQHITTLESDYKGKNACAEIAISENQQFLYASNRGENTIAVFKRNLKNGTVEKIQTISTFGNWPRNFVVSPNGKFLLVANKISSNISVFTIDETSGKLTFLKSTSMSAPVCLVFNY